MGLKAQGVPIRRPTSLSPRPWLYKKLLNGGADALPLQSTLPIPTCRCQHVPWASLGLAQPICPPTPRGLLPSAGGLRGLRWSLAPGVAGGPSPSHPQARCLIACFVQLPQSPSSVSWNWPPNKPLGLECLSWACFWGIPPEARGEVLFALLSHSPLRWDPAHSCHVAGERTKAQRG